MVVQWIRIHLPMQRTQVRSLVWEDSTCHGATKPECLEPVFHSKRSHGSEMLAHHKRIKGRETLL